MGLLTVALLAVFAAIPAAAQQADQQRYALGPDEAAPTFYAEVMPILQDNCVECHQAQGLNAGGMVAPMSLETYEDAKEWAPMIAFQVSQGNMPPWDVHPQHEGQFRNERYLEEDEKETLITSERNARGGPLRGASAP